MTAESTVQDGQRHSRRTAPYIFDSHIPMYRPARSRYLAGAMSSVLCQFRTVVRFATLEGRNKPQLRVEWYLQSACA